MIKMIKKIDYKPYFYTILILVFLPLACKKGPDVRKYKAQQPPPVTKQERATPSYSWQIPEGWKEIPSKSGMRLATFSIITGEKKATCTLRTMLRSRLKTSALAQKPFSWTLQEYTSTTEANTPKAPSNLPTPNPSLKNSTTSSPISKSTAEKS